MAIDDEFESSLYRKYSIGVSGEYLTSLKCSPCETKIALGYSSGALKLYDYFKERTIYHGFHHLQRIGTIEWSSDAILTGSKDQFLKLFDLRRKKAI
jgi:WD40 repeat protein